MAIATNVAAPAMAVSARIDNILSLHFAIEAFELGPRDERRLADDLGFDSLDLVEMFMLIEDEFGIEISDDDAQGFHDVPSKTMADLDRLVSSKMGRAG